MQVEGTIRTKDATIAPDARPEQLPIAPRRPRWVASPLWPCLLIALGIRVLLIIHTRGVVEGDEALVGIQAENILRGELPVYFYGQPYMGSVEAYLAAAIFWLFGPSVWALRAVGTALSLVLVWLTWRLAGALADNAKLPPRARLVFMSVAAGCAAVPPLYDGVAELHMLGGYIETYVLALLQLLSVLRLTQRWRAGISRRELSARWLGIGFVVGLSLWVNPLIASAVLAAGIWIAGYCLREMWTRKRTGRNIVEPWWRPASELSFAVVALPSCLLGMAPALVWGARHHWQNASYVLNFGGAGGQETVPQKVSDTYRLTRSFAGCVSPRLIGGALPMEGSLSGRLHAGLFAVAFAIILSIGAMLLWSFVRSGPQTAMVRQLMGVPTLFACCAIVLFCISSGSTPELTGCSLDWAGRYATPASLALPFLYATAFTLAWSIFRRQQQRRSTLGPSSAMGSGRPFSTSLIAWGQSLLLVFLLCFLGIHALTYRLASSSQTFQSNYCPQVPADNRPLLAYLQARDIHYIWGNNLLVYPLVFKSDLGIIGSDPLPLLRPDIAVNRIPSYTDAVLGADRPSMLFVVPHDDQQPRIAQALDKLSVTYDLARFYSQPGYDVIVVTPVSRTVSPLELSNMTIFICHTT